MNTVPPTMYIFGTDAAFTMWLRVVRRYDAVAGPDIADLKVLFRLAIHYENTCVLMDSGLLNAKLICCCMNNLVSCMAHP
jgi:hypothetical protein